MLLQAVLFYMEETKIHDRTCSGLEKQNQDAKNENGCYIRYLKQSGDEVQ